MVEGPSEELWSLSSLVAGKTTLTQPADPLLANFILTLLLLAKEKVWEFECCCKHSPVIPSSPQCSSMQVNTRVSPYATDCWPDPQDGSSVICKWSAWLI